MRIIKPLTLGIIHRTYADPPRHWLCVGAAGLFDFSGGTRLRIETELWKLAADALGTGTVARQPPPKDLGRTLGAPIDLGMPKATGEVMVLGKAMAPAGRAVPALDVRLQMGSIDKTLSAFGDRRWQIGFDVPYRMTDPEPFTEQPIDWAHAFGGPGFEANPAGLGYRPLRQAEQNPRDPVLLPTIEDPAKLVRNVGDTPDPAGFGPTDLSWRHRRIKAGTYGRRWRKTRWPGFAENMDWTIFNAAPEDQWWDGYFAGGESFRLTNMNTDHPILDGTVPPLVARSFIKRTGGGVEEVALEMDTLYLLPNIASGIVLWHGKTQVEDSDAADVEALLIAYERAHDPRRLPSHYEDVIAQRLNAEERFKVALYDVPLIPERTPEEEHRAREEKAEAVNKAKMVQKAVVKAQLEKILKDQGVKVPSGMKFPEPEIDPDLIIPDAAARRGELDLTALMSKVDAITAKAKADAERKKATAEKQRDSLMAALAQRGLVPKDAEKVAAQKVEAADRFRRHPAKFANDGVQTKAAVDQIMADLGVPVASLTVDDADQLSRGMVQSQDAQRLARRLVDKPIEPQEPLLPDVRIYLGQLVRDAVDRNEGLAGRDMAGADLAGADLQGLDLRETMLEGTDLRGARLDGANLTGAALTAAQLDGASFIGANLTDAGLNGISAIGTDFRDADLTGVFLNDAIVSSASFVNARINRVIGAGIDAASADFTNASLVNASFPNGQFSGTRFTDARLDSVIVVEADLSEADFSRANLFKVAFLTVSANSAIFDNARLERVKIGDDCLLLGARFAGVRAERCGFRGANLTGCIFSGSGIVSCDFGNCIMVRVTMRGSSAKESIFSGANLTEADLSGTDLSGALLRKATFDRTLMVGTNLNQAVVMETDFTTANLSGARISKQQRDMFGLGRNQQ